MMNRRQLLQTLLGAGVTAATGGRLFAAPEDYQGRLLVTLQCQGAWDVTNFCDPKVNQTGERPITNWSNSGEIQTAGNLQYAPVADNANFFQRYYRDTLIINGVDSQTNSHSTGELHSWSGRNAAGYPSLTALFAAQHAPELPLTYLNYGGYAETARLVRYSRVDDIAALRSVLTPNSLPWDAQAVLRHPPRLQQVLDAQTARLQRQQAEAGILPRRALAMQAYAAARSNRAGLADFAAALPDEGELQQRVRANGEVESNLRQQIQVAVLGFATGVSCAADLYLHGFDTHQNHDALHEPLLAFTTQSLDFLWQYAEQLGVADRLTVVVGSDFARTPHYNDSNGKDHWPIGSVMVMQRNAPWGNRVAGATDEGQNAYLINPQTLQRDDQNGARIYPRHVHQALRDLLGIQPDGFAFNNSEQFAFFEA